MKPCLRTRWGRGCSCQLQFGSGTHVLAIIRALLKRRRSLIVTGRPYDTLLPTLIVEDALKGQRLYPDDLSGISRQAFVVQCEANLNLWSRDVQSLIVRSCIKPETRVVYMKSRGYAESSSLRKISHRCPCSKNGRMSSSLSTLLRQFVGLSSRRIGDCLP